MFGDENCNDTQKSIPMFICFGIFAILGSLFALVVLAYFFLSLLVFPIF